MAAGCQAYGRGARGGWLGDGWAEGAEGIGFAREERGRKKKSCHKKTKKRVAVRLVGHTCQSRGAAVARKIFSRKEEELERVYAVASYIGSHPHNRKQLMYSV